MIDQFSDLIQLSKECGDISEFTTSQTEVDALKEGISKFDFTKVGLSNNQMKILFNDNTNSFFKQIIDQSSGIISTSGRDFIKKAFPNNPDFLYFLEHLSKFTDSNKTKNFNQISSENLDPLSYFLFVQQIFDSISTIPIDMADEQNALSEIIKYIILHSKDLSLMGNVADLNNEILKISENVPGANLQLFNPIFQDCYVKSNVHKNRISKDTINNLPKHLLEQSGADDSLITQLSNESESYYTLLSLMSSLIYYQNYLKNDTQNTFYPYGQLKGENTNEVRSKTTFMIEKVGQLLSSGKTTSGMYVIRLTVKWEKSFKGTRLSNASFIEISYQSSKKTYELNESEDTFVEIVLPSFSKRDDTVEISLVYVKEKFNDTLRKNVPSEGIGALVSFPYQLRADGTSGGGNASRSSNLAKTAAKNKSRPSSMLMTNNDELVVEFKRGDTELSKKCGTITVNSKFYGFQSQMNEIPEILQNNVFLTKSESGGYCDGFQMKQFLEFLISNMVNQWVSSSTISMSIYPPQEAFIGLIEFSMRYSIPASTVYLLICKRLLGAWCHAESYLNAFTSMFMTAYVCMSNNKKRINSLYSNHDDEELYRYIYEFLGENIAGCLILHLSKVGLYQNHGLIPLFILLSFIIPGEGINIYVDHLIQASHKKIIHSIINNLQPIQLNDGETNSEKMTKAISNLLEFANINKNDAFDKLMDKNKTYIDFTSLEPTKVTFTIKSLADTIEILNKRTKQLNKFYEDSSLPLFLSNQWKTIEIEFCQITLILVKLFLTILNEKFGDDQSIFKFIFSYRELHDFFMNLKQQNSNNNPVIDEITSEEFSPFKLFLNAILDWISRIGEQMNIWITNAVNIDTFEVDDKKLKTSSSPKDMFEVFRQSFNFLYSLHWEDPSIEVFVSTFLSLCGSCLRSFIETLTLKMLSYFPVEVIRESKIEAILHYADDLDTNPKSKSSSKKKDKHRKSKERKSSDNNDNSESSDSDNNTKSGAIKITTKSIFVIINNFMNLRFMWNGFLINVKKMFPSMFPNNEKEEEGIKGGRTKSVSSINVDLPPHVMDPVPKLTGITNSIPNLFSLVTSHLVTDTVSPHLWIKNSTVKQIFVKNASKYVLNPEFFKTGSPIFASIFDTILNYIKDRINDINAATCMKYYKTMIISFLFGLDSGMMNLLVRRKKKGGPVKNKRLVPILNFIQDLYKEIYEYVRNTSLENIFDNEEKLENYTPHSDFMFNHVHDDPEQLIDLVSKNCSLEILEASNEQDPVYLNALCVYIIVTSQNNEKRSSVLNWIQQNKVHFKRRHFYPPKYK